MIFPAFKDGDALTPAHMNAVFKELDRWRRMTSTGSIVVSGADSISPPVIEDWSAADLGAYCCVAPAGGIPAGTPPAGTGPVTGAPGMASGVPVYQINASGTYDYLGLYTVYNIYQTAFVAGKICTLVPDGSGNFAAPEQGC